jgi:hypothetical protein
MASYSLALVTDLTRSLTTAKGVTFELGLNWRQSNAIRLDQFPYFGD